MAAPPRESFESGKTYQLECSLGPQCGQAADCLSDCRIQLQVPSNTIPGTNMVKTGKSERIFSSLFETTAPSACYSLKIYFTIVKSQ